MKYSCSEILIAGAIVIVLGSTFFYRIRGVLNNVVSRGKYSEDPCETMVLCVLGILFEWTFVREIWLVNLISLLF